jgi:hypothetical protein
MALIGQNKCNANNFGTSGLASFCEHPNAVWLTKLFGGRDVESCEEAKKGFRACENDTRALCFAGLLGGTFDKISRSADLGDAFAQAEMVSAWADVKKFSAENLLLKENVMVSCGLEIATEMELVATKTRKKQRRTFWLPLSLGTCKRWFVQASYLTKTIRNDMFGSKELRRLDYLPS